MTDLENLPKSVPSPVFEVSVDVEGNITKHKYAGNFKYRVPNLKIRAAIEKEKARLNEGLDKQLDESILDFHSMYSYLKHTLSETPEWWKSSNSGYDLYDSNVLIALYLKAVDCEASWLKDIWGSSESEAENKQ